MEAMWIALQITLVGMGLVFAAILLLWGVMALLVKITGREPAAGSEEASEAERLASERELKQRAASAAVSLALATRNLPADGTELHGFPLPPTAVVSAWQTVMRTNILNKRGHVR